MLNTVTDSLSEEQVLTVTTSSQDLLQPRAKRQGLQVETDLDPVWVKLWPAGAEVPASSTSWNMYIPAGTAWPGTIGGVVWTGGISVIGTGAPTGHVSATGV